MQFEINVAYMGSHFFATHGRSITDTRTLRRMLKIFKKKFTESEGYTISVTWHESTHHTLDVEAILDDPNYDFFKD